jgi:zinc protease
MLKYTLQIVLLVPVLVHVVSAQIQTTPPPPFAPRTVTFPRPVEQALPNGLRVIVVERNDTPLVAVSLVIRNGGEVDPSGLAGVADLTANLLVKGTTTRDATRIASDIESLGGLLEAGARWDSSRVSVGVMSDKLGPAMSILADVVRRPVFANEEIERLRQQYIDDVTLALDDPGSIGRFVGAKVLYGDSAYGHPLMGTLESLKRISRKDIVRVHRLFYRPDNAILVIGGDINSDAGFNLARRYFGNWIKPSSRLTVPKAVDKQSVKTKARVVVVDKPDAGQAAVFIVHAGIDRKSPEYYSGLVANSVLSGYSGRLNQEIRIKRGLSYGAGSVLDARRGVGPFVASAQTKNESGVEVANLLMSGMAGLYNMPPPDAELTTRKAYLIGEFSRSLETLTGLVTRISSLAVYGLKLDEINRFIENVQAITGDDLKRFAMSMLGPESTSIIIVGKAEAFVPELKKRYSNVEVIPFANLDLNSISLRKK